MTTNHLLGGSCLLLTSIVNEEVQVGEVYRVGKDYTMII